MTTRGRRRINKNKEHIADGNEKAGRPENRDILRITNRKPHTIKQEVVKRQRNTLQTLKE